MVAAQREAFVPAPQELTQPTLPDTGIVIDFSRSAEELRDPLDLTPFEERFIKNRFTPTDDRTDFVMSPLNAALSAQPDWHLLSESEQTRRAQEYAQSGTFDHDFEEIAAKIRSFFENPISPPKHMRRVMSETHQQLPENADTPTNFLGLLLDVIPLGELTAQTLEANHARIWVLPTEAISPSVAINYSDKK